MSVSVEQLWNEKVYHNMPWLPGHAVPEDFRNKYVSLKPIRCVNDDTADIRSRAPLDWGDRLRKSWITYKYIATQPRQAWWKPQLNTWFDRLRYTLHLKLIEWKIVL